MSDNQDQRQQRSQGRKDREDERQQKRAQRRARQRGNNPADPQNGNNPAGTGAPQGGAQGNNSNNTPPVQPRGPVLKETPDLDGQSHAYNFNLPYGKKQKEEKTPKKGGGGDKHKPYPLEWEKFNGDKKKLIMEYLSDLWDYIFITCPLEAITNTTIASIDWFLYAPFGGGSDKKDKKEKKKDKTVLDYRDDVRDEYTAKANELSKIVSQAHQELKDNIEKAKNGQPTRWKEWGKAPACFNAFVELAQKAEADPNSEEAVRWKKFEKFPETMKKIIQKEDVLRYFSLTLAAANVAVEPKSVEIPKNISQKIGELSKVMNKSSDIVTLKDKMTEKIGEIRILTAGGRPVDVAVSEKLDEIQNIVSSPINDVDKIKKELDKKIKELNNVNAFPKKIKADSQVYYNSMSENIDKIMEAYKGQPAIALEKVKEYMTKIKTSVDSVEKETQKYVEERTFDIKKLRRSKIKKRIDSTIDVIDKFELEGMPISQRQQATERQPSLLSANRQMLLNSLTNFVEH